jgi:uncharacterized membrane protein YraQ (UPF0718 family)
MNEYVVVCRYVHRYYYRDEYYIICGTKEMPLMQCLSSRERLGVTVGTTVLASITSITSIIVLTSAIQSPMVLCYCSYTCFVDQ